MSKKPDSLKSQSSNATSENPRRQFLKSGLLSGAGLGAIAALGSIANAKISENLASSCTSPTPVQPKGPFYPVTDQLDKDNDLTLVQGKSVPAQGQAIYISGKVLDSDCQPIEGALVEIWQACETGKYNHPNDPNTAALDPNFQYFGRSVSKADGSYLFKTIIPGAYPADTDWVRPPHVHFRVIKRGYIELITQMYFAGNKYNNDDHILQSLSKEDQNSVVISPKDADSDQFGPNSKLYEFSLSLKSVRRRTTPI